MDASEGLSPDMLAKESFLGSDPLANSIINSGNSRHVLFQKDSQTHLPYQ